MLCWAFIFLGTAIIASLRDFGGVASTAADIAEVLSFLFLIVFIVCLVTGLISRPPPAGEPAHDPTDSRRSAADDPGEAHPGRAT
jgi:uncharacterized membrane protein YtjA (UPF0391 family)